MAVAGGFIVPHPPLILPEVGKGLERGVGKTMEAYRKAAREASRMHPQTVVVVSSHAPMGCGSFCISGGGFARGDFGGFGVPEAKVHAVYDTRFAEALAVEAREAGVPAGIWEEDGVLDHGTMVPLYFLRDEIKDFQVVRIGLSGLPPSEHVRLGRCIEQAAGRLGRRIVVIASGDLSHCLMDSGPYEYREEGPRYDQLVVEAVAAGRLSDIVAFPEGLCERAGECGHRAFAVLAGCLEGLALHARLLSYEGPYGVGYAVAVFQDAYVDLAMCAVRAYVKNKEKMPVPSGLPREMADMRAGVFVSLKEGGRLRGCIGTIQAARQSIAQEIIENAVSACAFDLRFYPVEEAELDGLVCTVDVLSPPQPISSEDELDVRRYGVIVTQGMKKGLLLPNLEGVETAGQQVRIALSKAGIDGGCYRMERFEVVRHV